MRGIQIQVHQRIRFRFRRNKAIINSDGETNEGRWAGWFNTDLGRLIRGIIKLAIATLIISLVQAIPFQNTTLTIGNGSVTLPVGTIGEVIVAFVPLLLVISALYDFGIRI